MVNELGNVFKFHNTTENDFNELYKNVSEFAKFCELERMVVNYYNKGEKPDFNNASQKKYYPWFRSGDEFRFVICSYHYDGISVPSSLYFLREEDLLEAVDIFIDVYRKSRNN